MIAIYSLPFLLPVLEYVEGKIVWDKGLGEATCRKYLRDIISGVMYLHSHVRFSSLNSFQYQLITGS